MAADDDGGMSVGSKGMSLATDMQRRSIYVGIYGEPSRETSDSDSDSDSNGVSVSSRPSPKTGIEPTCLQILPTSIPPWIQMTLVHRRVLRH